MSKTLLKIKQTLEIIADDNFDNVAEPEEKPACDILHHRKCSDISEACLGDYIEIDLGSYGTFTATVHQINDKNVMFIFDDCVDRLPMNNDKSVIDVFWITASLRAWLGGTFPSLLPSWLKERLIWATLPSVMQIYGLTGSLNPTASDEKLLLMAHRRYRIADWNGQPAAYWLRDAWNRTNSAASFASVTSGGHANAAGASDSLGVRPEIWIAK